MDDVTRDRDLAEAYWNRVVEPALKPLFIGAHMDGAKECRKSFADWLQAVPGIRMATVKPPEKRAAPSKKVAARSSRAVAPVQNRALRGAGLAAFDVVKNAGPLTSRELLGELRKLDGGRVSEQRDNTLLAAIRRLRKTGRLNYDGVHYRLPDGEPSEASIPQDPDSAG